MSDSDNIDIGPIDPIAIQDMDGEQRWDSTCPECGGQMSWCDSCQMWTRVCCVDYGTCMCS